MGMTFKFDNVERMDPGNEITFGSLDFIADQLKNLHLQKPGPSMHEDSYKSFPSYTSKLKISKVITG